MSDTIFSAWGPAALTLVGVILTQVIVVYVNRRKGEFDAESLLDLSEREFRKALSDRLKACEARHDDCQRDMAAMRRELNRMDRNNSILIMTLARAGIPVPVEMRTWSDGTEDGK